MLLGRPMLRAACVLPARLCRAPPPRVLSSLAARTASHSPPRPLLSRRLLCTSSAFSSSSSTAAAASTISLNPLSLYRIASRSFPLATAFATCFVKGSASDAIAQKQVEGAEKLDWKRNFAFAFFSGAWLGCGQHFTYNVAFTRIFGTGTDVVTAMKKVIADSTVHVPMVYLPLYYMFKGVVLEEDDGTASAGLMRYRADAYNVLTTYWSAWPLVHFTSFTILPVELRIVFVAGVSFVWLVYLSYASHKEDHERLHHEEKASDDAKP